MSRQRPARKQQPKLKDLQGRTVSAAVSRIDKIPEPPTADSKVLNDEQQVARVELMMLKGVRKPEVLGPMLGIESVRTVKAYIDRVHARWEITGGGRDISRYRGEALSRLDLVESELWSKFANLQDPKEQVMFLKLITEVSGQRNDLLGLTQRVLERLALMPDRQNELMARITAQQGLAQMASRLQQIIIERRKSAGLPPAVTSTGDMIDVTPTAVDDAEA